MAGLVSTIIPVFNRAALLREAVASVLAQTYRPIEIIVVDDGSTDDTPGAIANLSSKHPEVRHVRIENAGPGAAREAGRTLIRGDYVQHLDSDDLLLPRKFALQTSALERDRTATVAYGKTRHLDSAGHEVECTWKRQLSGEDSIFPHFLVARMWDTPNPLYRRDIVDRAGPWQPLRAEEDWEYDARIGALGARLTFTPEFVCEVRSVAGNRLSGGALLDPATLRDRATAHLLIADHARSAGMSEEPEFRAFIRELFFLARAAGAAGLASQSRDLVEWALGNGGTWDVRVYRRLASLLGWTLTGRLAMIRDRL